MVELPDLTAGNKHCRVAILPAKNSNSVHEEILIKLCICLRILPKTDSTFN